MAGWAGEVMGEIVRTEAGRVWAFGKRIGEMKGGHLSRDISARLSTMEKVEGQARWEG